MPNKVEAPKVKVQYPKYRVSKRDLPWIIFGWLYNTLIAFYAIGAFVEGDVFIGVVFTVIWAMIAAVLIVMPRLEFRSRWLNGEIRKLDREIRDADRKFRDEAMKTVITLELENKALKERLAFRDKKEKK